jgi:hypothetical protein
MAGTIYEIGRLAINQELEQSVFYVVNSMGDMGKYTARNDLPKTTIRIVNYLKNFGIATMEGNFNENANNAMDYLGDIGRIAVWSELNIMAIRSILKNVKDSIKAIRNKAKEKEFEETISTAELALEKIEKIVKEKKLEDGIKGHI